MLLLKNERVFCLMIKVSISSCFHAFYGLKQYANLVRRDFLLCGSTSQNRHFFVSEKGKTLEARLHSIPALNPRPEGKLQIYQNLAKQDLQIQSF